MIDQVKKSNPDKVCLPNGQGSLIVDEVKVGMKLIWSSKNNKFIGHAMTHDELASLTDVYTVLKPDYRQRQTSYVLQTVWRDLTSDFDIMGPHYTSDVTFSHGTLCRILMDSIHQFHVCGFDTVAVVCDGATSNLTMIKEMSGAPRKAYSLLADNESIKPCFISPYTGKKVHFVICPSHQLKNMVSAIFQSRLPEKGGTRAFKIDGVTFGWSVLDDLHSREMCRIQAGLCSRVPKLKKSHIVRDSWTRLNVLPSKVMQQDEVLAELREYARSDPRPKDAHTVEMVIQYLEALNKLFEKSILGSKVRIFMTDGTAMARMSEGFSFFAKWAKNIDADSEDQQLTAVEKRSFLAWQTWDLLRIMWYGFQGLVDDFTSSNPGYFVNPRRVNGSAVETIFGQLKHITSSNLTATNYETAKATLLTRRQSCAKGTEEYRSAKLYLRQSELSKKTK